MYVLLTDTANILKVRLTCIIWLAARTRANITFPERGAQRKRVHSLAFGSIFLEERDTREWTVDGKEANDYELNSWDLA